MVQWFHCDPGLLNPSYPVVVVVVVQFHLQDPPPKNRPLAPPAMAPPMMLRFSLCLS